MFWSFLICRICNILFFLSFFLSRVCLFHFRYVGKRNIARYCILPSGASVRGPSPCSPPQQRQEGSVHTHARQTQASRKPVGLGLGLCWVSCREQSPLLLAPCPFPPVQLLHDTPSPRRSWMPVQVCNVPHSRLQVRHESQLHLSSLSSSSAVSFALRPSICSRQDQGSLVSPGIVWDETL